MARSSRALRRSRWLPAGVAASMLALTAVVAINRSGDEQARAQSPMAAAAAAPSDAELTKTFDAMARAAARQDAAFFIEAAGSTPWSRRTWGNLEALGVDDIEMQYLASARQPSHVSVGVSWTPAADSAYDGMTTVRRRVTFTVGSTGTGGVAVLGAGSAGDSWLPVWLMDELSVSAIGEATVVSARGSALRVDVEALTRRALTAVHVVLGDSDVADRKVVVVVPRTAGQATRLGSRAAGMDGAAITSTVDGSRRTQAPVHVVLDPAALDRLTRRGAQTLVTHEVTHALTGAATVAMPLWVAEGFADWVALRDGRVPVDVAASRLLADVRADGLPDELPTEADFTERRAATAYEAAWTVFRSLDQRVGERAVTSFYADVVAARPVAQALKGNTGLQIAELARTWRADLRRLAGG